MSNNDFLESLSKELSGEPFCSLGNNLHNFNVACGNSAEALTEDVEGSSPTFFEDACFFGRQPDQCTNGHEDSFSSLELDKTFGSLSSDSGFACLSDNSRCTTDGNMSPGEYQGFNQDHMDMQCGTLVSGPANDKKGSIEKVLSPSNRAPSRETSGIKANLEETQTAYPLVSDAIASATSISQADRTVYRKTSPPSLTRLPEVSATDTSAPLNKAMQCAEMPKVVQLLTANATEVCIPSVQRATLDLTGSPSPTVKKEQLSEAPNRGPAKRPNILARNNKVAKPPSKPKKAVVKKPASLANQQATAPTKAFVNIAPRERTTEELNNCAWATLTHEERWRLVLIHLHELDPAAADVIGNSYNQRIRLKQQNPGTTAFVTANPTPTTTASTIAASTPNGTSPLSDTRNIYQETSASKNMTIQQPLGFGPANGKVDKITHNNGSVSYGSAGHNHVTYPNVLNNPGMQNANTLGFGVRNNAWGFGIHDNSLGYGIQGNNTMGFGLQINNVTHFGLERNNDLRLNTQGNNTSGFRPQPNIAPMASQSFYPTPNNNNNNFMAQAVQMPARPAVYGPARQHEAFQRNTQFQTQGHRRQG